jgi:FADH2 O2-dependent halogenase
VRTDFDIAVAGSGFGGSLLAMIARRLGRSVILLERGRHPRFAIGESSTPLANLLLEELARRYGLPEVAALSKWGAWQKSHPEIACGLKRGFTFYHHTFDRRWQADASRNNELLVAASPHDAIADTHWYRPDFDHFLVQQAQKAGVEYLDEVSLAQAECSSEEVVLRGHRAGQALVIRAKCVVDATGPRGFLHRALGLGEGGFAGLPKTQALYTHFESVRRWDSLQVMSEPPPYPVDDAAVHHVFDGGWIWVLRFNHGITSAGVAATEALAAQLRFSEGQRAWNRLLEHLPSVKEQFAAANATLPFVHSPRLSFRSATAAGERWALLPSAAGFVDPLLSTGFPLTLLGIERLGRILEADWNSERFSQRLAAYGQQTLRELDVAAALVGGLYSNMRDFGAFSALTLLYFAAAMQAETLRRLGRGAETASFLLENDPQFGPALRNCLEWAGRGATPAVDLAKAIRRAIEPINLARLGEPARRNWYPCLAEDLLEGAPKLGTDRAAIESLLARCGFAGK